MSSGSKNRLSFSPAWQAADEALARLCKRGVRPSRLVEARGVRFLCPNAVCQQLYPEAVVRCGVLVVSKMLQDKDGGSGVDFFNAVTDRFEIHFPWGVTQTTGRFLRKLLGMEVALELIDIPLGAPPLTLKEVSAFQKLLPSSEQVTRAQLREIGFDLEDQQLSTYCEHYRRYPAFVQAVT